MLTGTWMVAISVVLLAGFLAWRVRRSSAAPLEPTSTPTLRIVQPTKQPGSVGLPSLSDQSNNMQAITRLAMLHTSIPERERHEVITYTVEGGDAVFSIAKSFDLHPETVLYANYDQLSDSPDMLSPGMVLRIPPVDGIY
jgi:nucleoid-associated protein YgaU